MARGRTLTSRKVNALKIRKIIFSLILQSNIWIRFFRPFKKNREIFKVIIYEAEVLNSKKLKNGIQTLFKRNICNSNQTDKLKMKTEKQSNTVISITRVQKEQCECAIMNVRPFMKISNPIQFMYLVPVVSIGKADIWQTRLKCLLVQNSKTAHIAIPIYFKTTYYLFK